MGGPTLAGFRPDKTQQILLRFSTKSNRDQTIVKPPSLYRIDTYIRER